MDSKHYWIKIFPLKSEKNYIVVVNQKLMIKGFRELQWGNLLRIQIQPISEIFIFVFILVNWNKVFGWQFFIAVRNDYRVYYFFWYIFKICVENLLLHWFFFTHFTIKSIPHRWLHLSTALLLAELRSWKNNGKRNTWWKLYFLVLANQHISCSCKNV